MKIFLIFVEFIFFFFCVSISSGKAIYELPMYGGKVKTKGQIEADNKFIEEAIKSAGSREKATSHFLKRGWQYLSKGDLKTSIKRFNQAWLITPDHPEIFWGFGIVLARKKDFDESIKMFKESYRIDHANPRLLIDFAHIYGVKAFSVSTENEKSIYLNKAIQLYEEAANIDPNFGPLYFQWAVTLYYMEQYKEAWNKIQTAQEKGVTVDPNFLKELEKKMPMSMVK